MKNVFFPGLMCLSFVIAFSVSAQEYGINLGSIVNAESNIDPLKDSTHNCRFWGMLSAGSFNDSTKMSHLNSLRHLASSNPNGWGFGFYTETVKGGIIPVLYRGMWRADEDYLFDTSAKLMLNNLSTCGIAHIRNSSSGYVNIPNPHPFYTKSMQRDFSMLFAHNGTLSKPTLVTLLDTYTDNNHYSYSGDGVNDPNHDSDLYRLFLMKWIDEHPYGSVTACLTNALILLTTEMGSGRSYNFIMASSSDTLWALRYGNTLSYRRESGSLGFVWEVASEPLGGTDWVKATNHYLYVFTTSQATPDSVLIENQAGGVPEMIDKSISVGFKFANPTAGNSLDIEINANNSQSVSLQLFDTRGQFLSKKSNITVHSGANHFIYDISHLKAGMYFLKMVAGKNSQTKKIVIAH